MSFKDLMRIEPIADDSERTAFEVLHYAISMAAWRRLG